MVQGTIISKHIAKSCLTCKRKMLGIDEPCYFELPYTGFSLLILSEWRFWSKFCNPSNLEEKPTILLYSCSDHVEGGNELAHILVWWNLKGFGGPRKYNFI